MVLLLPVLLVLLPLCTAAGSPVATATIAGAIATTGAAASAAVDAALLCVHTPSFSWSLVRVCLALSSICGILEPLLTCEI
jgi:hypothetical protein